MQKDKKTHLGKELKQVEKSWKNEEIRHFYHYVKRGKGQHGKPSNYLKDKEGHLIREKEGEFNRFAECFEEL